MLNETALTLTLVLIVVCVLGAWLLTSLMLRARRDAAVENLVLTHLPSADSAATEQVLLERIQSLRAKARERQILVGCLAVLMLLTVVIGFLVTQTLLMVNLL